MLALVRRVRTASATVRASTMPSAMTTKAAVQASAPVMAWSRENIPTVRALLVTYTAPLPRVDAPAEYGTAAMTIIRSRDLTAEKAWDAHPVAEMNGTPRDCTGPTGRTPCTSTTDKRPSSC